MKHLKKLLFLLLIFSVATYYVYDVKKTKSKKNHNKQQNFSLNEQKILKSARGIIKRAYFGTLISIDHTGQPKARLMEPFLPGKNFEIYLATNPKSRKVKELLNNPVASMHYIDEPRTG